MLSLLNVCLASHASFDSRLLYFGVFGVGFLGVFVVEVGVVADVVTVRGMLDKSR